jgi:hypothetical protein
MVWPTWLWIGTPLKLSVWLVNRAATGTSMVYLWKTRRSRRSFLASALLLQAGSAALLIWLLFRLR